MLKWLWKSKMETKFKKSFRKPKNKFPKWRGNLSEKLRLEKANTHILANKNNLPFMRLNQIQSHLKPTIHTELERQQYNGLIYANIAKLR